MTVGAWYHLDTLEHARDERLAAMWCNHEMAKLEWDRNTPMTWGWSGLFPKKRPMTPDEYYSATYGGYCVLYWLYPENIRHEEKKMNKLIKLAKRSHDNLVFLEDWHVGHFGDHLAPPVINPKPEMSIP